MNEVEYFSFGSENSFFRIDRHANFLGATTPDKSISFPLNSTFYEIDGQICEVSEIPEDTCNSSLYVRLTTKKFSGKLAIFSQANGVRMRLLTEEGRIPKSIGIVLTFPLEVEFHLPEAYNLGRKIDRRMPLGEHYTTELGYNFFLVNLKDVWIMLMSKQTRLGSSTSQISRHPELFTVTYTWKATDEALFNIFTSMDDAIRNYETWLEELNVKKLRDDPEFPTWVDNVKLVIVADMIRSNWEIVHDYDDVARLVNELKSAGAPKDTLIYIPGWNGAYDSNYPNYRPHAELGGDEGFKRMMETVHKCHFRIMIHTNAWGLDPYQKDIDQFLKYVVKDEEGHYQGWQTGGRIWGGRYPPSRPLKFKSGKLKIHAPRGSRSFDFETIYVPDACEALIKIGGFKMDDGRCVFTLSKRSMSTPPSWFRTHQEYAFPFPFSLQAGVNRVHVEFIGGSEPDWNGIWYEILDCFIPKDPYTSWTHPILFADMNNQGWIRTFVKEVVEVVRKYQIDAVHVDATPYDMARRLLDSLKEELEGVAISGENLETLWDLGYWTFCQNARQSLTGYLEFTYGTCEQSALPDRSRVDELFSWLNNTSPVCKFIDRYVRFYPHLCAADAFVPVGKVCNTFPSRLSPRSEEDLWKTICCAGRLGYIPALRVNYRQYGLDGQTKKAIQELVG